MWGGISTMGGELERDFSTKGGELKPELSTLGGWKQQKNETFFLVFRIMGYEKMVVENFFWIFLAIIGKLVVLLHLETI